MLIVILIVTIFVFYMLTRNYNKYDYNTINPHKRQKFDGNLKEHEAGLIVSLMAKVAKADGRVSELEAELISNTLTELSSVFENQASIREDLKRIYKSELESFKNTVEMANKYYNLTKNNYQKRVGIIEFLLNLAFIDNEFTNEEYMICEDISSAFKIKKEDFISLVSKFKSFYAQKYNKQVNTIENAYKVLNATKEDDMQVIKSKYKKLVRENHPDLLMGKGASKSVIETATIKLQEINEAYEIIKKSKKTVT